MSMNGRTRCVQAILKHVSDTYTPAPDLERSAYVALAQAELARTQMQLDQEFAHEQVQAHDVQDQG